MAVGEWDQRQLCPDGGCVGVIGPDGTCKVCGRAAANWGDERKRGLLDPPDEEDEDDEDDEDDDEADLAGHDEDDDDGDEDDGEDAGDDDDAGDGGDDAPPPGPTIVAASAGEWNERALCPDGSCIGVIGVDGRCKVCGRTAATGSAGARPDALAMEPAGTAPPLDAPAADPDSGPAADPESKT